jgi:hypothetical protein
MAVVQLNGNTGIINSFCHSIIESLWLVVGDDVITSKPNSSKNVFHKDNKKNRPDTEEFPL